MINADDSPHEVDREPISVGSYFMYPREYDIEGCLKYELFHSQAYSGIVGMLWFSEENYISHRLSDYYICKRNMSIADIENAFKHHFKGRIKECRELAAQGQPLWDQE